MAVQSGTRYTLQTAASDFDVISFDLQERLSHPFVLTLVLSSSDDRPDFGRLIDENATFTLWSDNEAMRHVNGIITGFRQKASGFRRTHYEMIIQPAYVRADLSSNCRAYQQQTIVDVIKGLLDKTGINNAEWRLNDNHNPREYCVQYRETDQGFIERLAAEEGISYHFEHNDKDHTLVFSDQAKQAKNIGTVLYNGQSGGDRSEPCIWSLDVEESLATAQHVMRDYTFTHPRYDLEHQHQGQNIEHQQGHYQKFDYPGRYKEDSQGAPFNQYRLEFERSDSHLARAEGDDMRPLPGHVLTLTEHPRSDLNQDWLVVGVSHSGVQPQSQGEEAASAEGGSRYSNTLHLIPHQQPWRPEPQEKPRVDGPQIAHIVGPKDEEIYCDEFGRVKVQFPWDRYGQMDEHSSCWIRVSQNWAGGAWGHMAIPRIGHEVIVDFLEGDPDQPIVTGRTYHANNPPPYALPENKTRMTIKSQTHKGEGFNELRFEDEAEQEEIFMHAQKDQNNVVNNDETTRVGHDRSEEVTNDEIINIGRDRKETVGNDETLEIGQDQKDTIGRDRYLMVNRSHHTDITKDFIEHVGNHRQEYTYANHDEDVGGNYDHYVKGKYNRQVGQTTSEKTTRFNINGSSEVNHVGPGGNIIIDGGGITVNASQIQFLAGGISITTGGGGGASKLDGIANQGKALNELCGMLPDGTCSKSVCPCGRNG